MATTNKLYGATELKNKTKKPFFEHQTKKATASDISGTIQCAITVNLS